VELFHLHFVRLFCLGPDKNRFAIKGGCNLRFFFESVRYSENLDLDVERIPFHTLKEKVCKMEGAALRLPLKSRGISVREVSAPKQTETTQRGKVGLAAEGRSLPLHTKIDLVHLRLLRAHGRVSLSSSPPFVSDRAPARILQAERAVRRHGDSEPAG
jgi:hypothetical protein